MPPADDKRSISRSHLPGDQHSADPGLDSKMEMGGIGDTIATAGVNDIALTISPSDPVNGDRWGLNEAANSDYHRLMDGGVARTDREAGLDTDSTTSSDPNGVLDSISLQNRVDVRFSGVSTWVSAAFMPPSSLALLRQKLIPQWGAPDALEGEQSQDSKRQVGPSNSFCRSVFFALDIKLLEWPCCGRSAMAQ